MTSWGNVINDFKMKHSGTKLMASTGFYTRFPSEFLHKYDRGKPFLMFSTNIFLQRSWFFENEHILMAGSYEQKRWLWNPMLGCIIHAQTFWQVVVVWDIEI